MYVDAPPGAAEAIVHYKPFGGTHYRSTKMDRFGPGFATLLPYGAIEYTGDLKYFILINDANGGPIDSLGSRMLPMRVTIREKIEGDPPALPGRKPPPPCPRDCRR
jgi:hypothetical protein